MYKNILLPEERMKNVIFSQIDKNDYKVFLFGSRAGNNARFNSDYDIGILGKNRLNYSTYLKLKRKLNELPYLVDLVDFQVVDNDFKTIALKQIVPWN